jgi:type II secretory pathway pseudopilin PulG
MRYFPRRESISRGYADRVAGFTLLEILVILVIVGMIAAIAAPSWLQFWANRQVTVARDDLRQGIQQAQAYAINQRQSWRFSLRETPTHLEWAIHPNHISWQAVPAWHPLPPNIVLAPADTTLAQKDDIYYVRFGFQGEVQYRLSTLTLDTRNGQARNQCVIISTLLGATRKGVEHPFPNGNDRYCY